MFAAIMRRLGFVPMASSYTVEDMQEAYHTGIGETLDALASSEYQDTRVGFTASL